MKFKVYDICAVCSRRDECELEFQLSYKTYSDEKTEELLDKHQASIYYAVTECGEFELECSETWYYNDDMCHVADITLYDDIFPKGFEVADLYIHKNLVGEIYVPYPWEEELGGEIPFDDEDKFWEIYDEYRSAFIERLLEYFANELHINIAKLDYREDKEGWGLAINSEKLYWRLVEKFKKEVYHD